MLLKNTDRLELRFKIVKISVIIYYQYSEFGPLYLILIWFGFY